MQSLTGYRDLVPCNLRILTEGEGKYSYYFQFVGEATEHQRMTSCRFAKCAFEVSLSGSKFCGVSDRATVVLSGAGRPLEAGEIRVQCWVCGVAAVVTQEALGHWFSFSGKRVCPPNDFCRCVCDMFSRCKKDGPVPKAKPRDVSDFSLYAPATKPCSPAHIRDPDRCCCSQ